MTLRGDMQFQIDTLWKCFREAQRRGDAALKSRREGDRIKQEIIDELKAENAQLKNQLESSWVEPVGYDAERGRVVDKDGHVQFLEEEEVCE